MSALALSNDNAVFIAWSFPEKIPGCIGFTVRRLRAGRAPEPLPAYVGFEGQDNPAWQPRTTDVWPVQKFSWKDLSAPTGEPLSYEIVALRGPASAPIPMPDVPALRTNPVTVTPDRGGVKVWFNRGLISTQFTARLLGGDAAAAPSAQVLLRRVAQQGDPLRQRLAVGLPAALKLLLDRAQAEGGTCHAALYELTDAELLGALLSSPRLQIVLSNANAGEGEDGYDGENAAARAALREAGHAPVDRFMPAGHIGHDKFVVYVDAGGTPRAVLTGSTNWTPTGLCTQTNNAILVEDGGLATQYLDFWRRLVADAQAAGVEPGEPAAPNAALQGSALRTADASPGQEIDRTGGGAPWSLRAFFSPNTKERSKPKQGATPVDLAQVYALMHGARQAILFLAFQPGTPSILTELAAIADDRKARGLPPLLIRGAVTDPAAAGTFETDLYHHQATADASVVGVQGIPAPFAYWHREIYKAGHAVIHDKIVVIDPLDAARCAVVTGSHNLGFRASYMNDENLLIVRGSRSVAEAYATHVLDVYDHFRWRWFMQSTRSVGKATSPQEARAWKPPRWQGLFDASDAWQDRYFQEGSLAGFDRRYWGGEAAASVPPDAPSERPGLAASRSTGASGTGAGKLGRPAARPAVPRHPPARRAPRHPSAPHGPHAAR